jgi:GLPGLI family protein
MKKIVFIFMILCNIVSAQKYETIDTVDYSYNYNYEFQEDSTRQSSIQSCEMILQTGKTTSLFTSVSYLYVDSLLYAFKDEPTDVAAMKILPYIQGIRQHAYCKYHIYKNFPEEDVSTFINTVDGKNFRVSNENKMQWELVQNSDTVLLGYNCLKAKTRFAGRNYEAWYSPEIPVSDGPYKFSGLPGLIVSISDTQNQHSFKLEGISKSDAGKPIVFIRKDYLNVSAEEYTDALNARMARLFNRVQQENNIQFNSEEAKARALDRLKSRNNFIEIY